MCERQLLLLPSVFVQSGVFGDLKLPLKSVLSAVTRLRSSVSQAACSCRLAVTHSALLRLLGFAGEKTQLSSVYDSVTFCCESKDISSVVTPTSN